SFMFRGSPLLPLLPGQLLDGLTGFLFLDVLELGRCPFLGIDAAAGWLALDLDLPQRLLGHHLLELVETFVEGGACQFGDPLLARPWVTRFGPIPTGEHLAILMMQLVPGSIWVTLDHVPDDPVLLVLAALPVDVLPPGLGLHVVPHEARCL